MIQKLAKQDDLSIQEIAYRTGIDLNDMITYFNGTAVPDLAEFLNICQAIGIRPFFELKDNHSPLNDAVDDLLHRIGDTDPDLN